MKRHLQRKQQRARGGVVARETTIPLPLNGLFVEAKTAEVSAVYASELSNFKSNSVSLEVEPSHVFGSISEIGFRRIPFEFGIYSQYIESKSEQLQSGAAVFSRSMAEDASHTYISSQAIIADGRADPIRYNGAEFSAAVFTTTTGFEPRDFDGVVAHQDRLFFWKHDGDLEFYYGDVGAVEGELTRFPLGRLGNIQGKIRSMFSLTFDAGENVNDALCIVTTTGELVVYEGINPGDANDWNLTARVATAPPISKAGFTRVGGDVWMITTSGIVSAIDSIRQGILALVGNISRPISKEILDLVTQGGGEWQLHTSATGDRIIINRYENGAAKQFNYQTETRAWNTTNYPARRWHNLALQTQFTDSRGVLATLPRVSDGSTTVKATWSTGWFNLRRASEIKYIRPTIIANGALSVRLVVLSDHDETVQDITEAEQTVTVYPDDPDDAGGKVALNEDFAVDAIGQRFKMTLEIEASSAEIVSVDVGVL
ncbi:MAG: hypothetical protein AAGD43_04720 [Pseudomonadota bacterium]